MQPACPKIAVIGAGSVGAAVANALLHRNIAGEVHLVDTDQALCRAQVQDLSDAAFFSGSVVKQGQYPAVGQCDIIIVTAGAKQRPGDTRLNLVDRNLAILKNILHALMPLRDDSILLLVTNPVDVLTYFAQHITDLPCNQIIGSGTSLDSVRLRHELGERLQVGDKSVEASVYGEHGDSQFISWSSITVGGIPLPDHLPLSSEAKAVIAEATRDKAYKIVEGKGHTCFGIAAVVASLCETILLDQRHVRLSEEECGLIERSARTLRKVIDQHAHEGV